MQKAFVFLFLLIIFSSSVFAFSILGVKNVYMGSTEGVQDKKISVEDSAYKEELKKYNDFVNSCSKQKGKLLSAQKDDKDTACKLCASKSKCKPCVPQKCVVKEGKRVIKTSSKIITGRLIVDGRSVIVQPSPVQCPDFKKLREQMQCPNNQVEEFRNERGCMHLRCRTLKKEVEEKIVEKELVKEAESSDKEQDHKELEKVQEKKTGFIKWILNWFKR